MSCTGQSDTIHVASKPAEKHATCLRVTTRPGGATRGPTRTIARAYPVPRSAISSQTSGWGCHAGNRAAAARTVTGIGSCVVLPDVQRRQDHAVQHDRGDDADREHPAEDRTI